ncbi:MAG: putative MPP superfamily phosphohydrolase [Bradymonadia bacterium]|jgi:predicted MPP superfamily phosphohydrolase
MKTSRMTLFFALAMTIWFGGHALVSWRIASAFPDRRIALGVALVFAVLAIAWPFVIGWLRTAELSPLVERARLFAWLYFGFFSVLIVAVLAKDALLLLVGLVDRVSPGDPLSPERRDWFRQVGSVGALGVTTAATAAAWRGGTRLAPVIEVEVPIEGLDPRLDGFTIAQVSDVHIGQPLTKYDLERIVVRTNAIGADLIALTGDLVDGRVSQLVSEIDPIADFSAPHGVFFVTGNHEYYSGAKEWEREVAARGVRVLTNEHDVLTVAGAPFVVAGVTDYTAGQFIPEDASDPVKALAGAPEDAFRLLLAHQPKSVPAAVEARASLQLSGHTHGGQYAPFSWIIDRFHPVTSGLSKYEGVWVYVSRGTGVWGPPMRLGAPNEITKLTLRAV